MPCFSMGSRFDSDIRSKDHIKPRKSDVPGPGSYSHSSSLKVLPPLGKSAKTTFGTGQRNWNRIEALPGPNHYNPVKFTEASH
jgi:hypothetical protein